MADVQLSQLLTYVLPNHSLMRTWLPPQGERALAGRLRGHTIEVVPASPRGHPGPRQEQPGRAAGLACPGVLPGGWQFARPGRGPGRPLGVAIKAKVSEPRYPIHSNVQTPSKSIVSICVSVGEDAAKWKINARVP